MIKEANKSIAINKLLTIVSILFIFSFSIEAIIQIEYISKVLLGICLILAIFNILLCDKKVNIQSMDIIMYIFLVYICINTFFRGNFNDAINVIVGSLIPYYIGRIIVFDKKSRNIFLVIVDIISIIIIVYLVMLFIKYDFNAYRTRELGNINRIAIGEAMGIFSITNYFSINKQSKRLFKIVNITNYLLGILVCLIILNSRGALFFIIITTLLMEFLCTKKRLIWAIVIISVIISYLLLFKEGSPLFDIIPEVSRFSVKSILSDPSIVGSNTYDKGRVQLYQQCLNIFMANPLFGGGIMSAYPHNIFFEILGTLGIVGLVIFICFIFTPLKLSRVYSKEFRLIVALFIYCLMYRQTSFAMNAHKTLFLFAGILITVYENYIEKQGGNKFEYRRENDFKYTKYINE